MNSVSLVGRQCSEKKENNSKNKQKRVHHLGERIGGGAKKKKIQNEQCQFGKRTMFERKENNSKRRATLASGLGVAIIKI